MKKLYDEKNNVGSKSFPKVGDRVYVLAPNEKSRNARPKLTYQWAGPFRALEVSQNSALVGQTGENSDPVRIQFKMLRIVLKEISDDRV